jgi:predicted restriction endonuclease
MGNNMTLVDEIVSAFEALGGIAPYADLYKYIEDHAERELPRTWKASIRARIEERSSDSLAFKHQEDLFYAVEGLGNGVWGLNSYLHSSPVAIDIEEPNRPQKVSIETTRIIRDTKITKQLKLLYKNACQICGKVIRLSDQDYSEAHHVKPLGNHHNGPDTPGNILIVCPNHHVELDYGSIAIDPETNKIIHINAKDEFYGSDLIIRAGHNLDPKFLRYHLENIFSSNL